MLFGYLTLIEILQIRSISRFEKLDITPKSAEKIKPVLEKWMKEAEDRFVDFSSLFSNQL